MCRRSSSKNGLGGGVVVGATSQDFFAFRIFLGRAVTFDAGPVAFGARLKAFLGPNAGAMKVSARRTASLRPSCGDSRVNGAEPLADSVGLNCVEIGRASWGTGKAMLPGVHGLKHLDDRFSIGRVAKVARR